MKEIKEVECDPFADLDGTDEDDTHKDPSAEDLVEHSVNIDELVSQFDSSMTTAEYIEADDDPTTSFTFNDLDNWREELRAMVCMQKESPQQKHQKVKKKMKMRNQNLYQVVLQVLKMLLR